MPPEATAWKPRIKAWEEPEWKPRVRELRPGEDYTIPIGEQHPELSLMERLLITNVALGEPANVTRSLEKWGYEARPLEGNNYAIRRPGGRWFYVDSPRPELADVGDVYGDIYRAGSELAGGVAGLVMGAPTGPGAFGTAAAGGAVGGATAEGVLQALGKLGGLATTPTEAAKEVGQEALLGAASEAGGALIGRGLTKAGQVWDRAVAGVPTSSGELAEKLTSHVAEEARRMRVPPAALIRQYANQAGIKEAYTAPVEELKAKLIKSQIPRSGFGVEKKRQLIDRMLKEHAEEGVEASWVTEAKTMREGVISRSPKVAELEDVIQQLSDVGEDEARKLAAKLMGRQAHQVRYTDLPEAAYKAQPGVVKGTGMSGEELAQKHPHLRKVWDKTALERPPRTLFQGDFRDLDLDTVRTLRVGDSLVDFAKPGPLTKGLRQGAKAIRGVDRKLTATRRLAGSALRKAGIAARHAARWGPLHRYGLRGVMADFMTTGGKGVVAVDLLAKPAGKGLQKLGRKMMRDQSGHTLERLLGGSPGMPSTLRRAISQVLQARERGPSVYRAAVFTLLHNPQFRAYLDEHDAPLDLYEP